MKGALKGRQIRRNVTDRAPGVIPTSEDTRSLPSTALIERSHFNNRDPRFRFAPPWAEAYHAFGVLLRTEAPEVAIAAECFLR
jgi:hypothetical protein